MTPLKMPDPMGSEIGMSEASILHLEKVSKRYARTATPAVNEVTLTLQSGDLLGLLGPSGCGKTTLLRIIAGFERQFSGKIAISGHTVASSNVWIPPEQRHVGMVFQDYALFPHLTVAKNIAFGLKKKTRLGATEVRKRVQTVLALVGLEGLEERYPHQLSGGQQQRIALARALAPRPALVLLDEPLSNLDVQVRLRLRQELREILKAAGTSAIFVTHDQQEALSISDRVAVMCQGSLQQLGTPEEIYSEPASRFVAEFVTQANFLPAQRRGRIWQTEIGSFQLEAVAEDEILQGEQADLMLTQEDLTLHPDDGGNAVIRDRQFLGCEYRYRLQTASGRELVARPRTRRALAVGTRVKVGVNPQSLRLFPATTPPMRPYSTLSVS